MQISFEKIALRFFIIGLLALAFVGGTAVQYYKIPPSRFLSEAYESATAWWEALTSASSTQVASPKGQHHQKPTPSPQVNEEIIQNPRVSLWKESAAYNGYTLIATGFFDAAFLVDMEGTIVHRWDMPFRKAWPDPKHVHTMARVDTFLNFAHIYPNGDLLAQYAALGDTPYGYGIVKMDKNSKVLWTYDANAHHDFYVDKGNGNIYALTHEMIKQPVVGFESLQWPMLADFVVVLTPQGKEIEKISLIEAFRDTPFEYMMFHPRNGGLTTWDHFHTNSVTKLEPEMADKFPMFKPGYIMVSIRSFNAIAVIDPKTRKVVWAYNGSWKMQHAAHFLPNGNILLLDNNGHAYGEKNYSRVIEFDPKTLGVKWMYAGSPQRNFHTVIIGRVQRLPNGNTLIAESMKAKVFEVTPKGQIVWQYNLRQIPRRDSTLNAILTSMRYHKKDLPFLQEKR